MKPTILTRDLKQLMRDLWLVGFSEGEAMLVFVKDKYTITVWQEKTARQVYRTIAFEAHCERRFAK